MTSDGLISKPDEIVSAAELADAISKGVLSAEEAMEQCLARIEEFEPDIHAFVQVCAREARAAAKSADRVPAGKRGLLHGVPVAIKEIFDVAGMRCCWGSKIHADRVPASDAEAVKRLKNAGAIVVGTVVSTEYAIAAAGPTVNPHDHSRTPGGSSSGPAAAVASGMVPFALGSQTVGSIVRPAAYCGLFGLKPTMGAISMRGSMPLSPRLDHPGLIARTADDIALGCRVLFGGDRDDPGSRDIAAPGVLPRIKGLRILLARDMPPDPVSQRSLEALGKITANLEAAGAKIEEYAFPGEYNGVVDILYTIMTRDMARIHGEDYANSSSQMSLLLRELMDHGMQVSDSEYMQAVKTAEQWRSELTSLLGNERVLLSPATVDMAPPLAEGTGSNRPQALWSLVGLPVIAIPAGLQGNLPIGVQAAAGPGNEAAILSVSQVASHPS